MSLVWEDILYLVKGVFAVLSLFIFRATAFLTPLSSQACLGGQFGPGLLYSHPCLGSFDHRSVSFALLHLAFGVAALASGEVK